MKTPPTGGAGGALSTWISGWARRLPSKLAIRCDGEVISYAELAKRVDCLAAGLHTALGVGRGDRVAFLGLNSPRMLELLFACSHLGAMLVPLSWRLTGSELSVIVQDAQPRVIAVEEAFLSAVASLGSVQGPSLVGCDSESEAGGPSLRQLARRTPSEPAPRKGASDLPLLICYTSGTTGKPKGAVLTQGALFWNAVNSTHMHDLTSADRVLTVTPMFHVGGLNIQTLPALHAGATVTLHRKLDPGAFFDTVENEKITLTQLVPTQLNSLMTDPRWATADLSSLRLVVTGSTLVPESLDAAFGARGLNLIQVYGSTETGPIAVYGERDQALRVPKAAGRPAIHCDVRIVDDEDKDVEPGALGEIWIRGPNVMAGYCNRPEETAAALKDGWFHSGDIGHADADGNIFIDGRKTDMIISGGENIYSAELENVLAGCPAIREAAIVGRKDAKWGEVPVAVVVRAEGRSIEAGDVLALFEARLARFKHPRDVVFVDALPRNTIGKIQKHEILRMLETM